MFTGPKRALLVTGLVYLSIFLNFFLVGTIIPLIPRLADARGISSIEASLVLSIKSFTHMAVSPILALMASHWKPVKLFSFGQLSLAGAYMGCAFSTSLGGFIAARIAQGIGIASIMVAGMSLLVETVPKEKRGRYIAFAYSGLAHASLVAPVLSAVMYDSLGQVWTFLIPGIMTLVIATATILLLNRFLTNQDTDSEQPPVDHAHLDRSLIIPFLKSIFSLSIGYLAYLGIFSCGFAFGSIEASIPRFMVDIHFSVLTSNLLWSAGALTFAISAPIIGLLIDKFHPSLFLISAMLSYVVFGPLIHFIPSSVGGLAGTITVSFFIQALAEISIYPLATCLVETASAVIKTPSPQSVNIVGFCLVEMFVQAGFAVGNIIGKLLYEWNGLYGVGIGISAIPAGTILILILIYFILSHRC